MDILVKPILTEKATDESELRNSYTFIVSKNANKIQIKKAIEESYGVSVLKVRTMIYGAKSITKYTKRGIQSSKKGAYKKALVKISEGDRIDFFANL
tara:strand:- start:1045 stop:1335 length:291 start_codon:yes stop_codon:yes gene_type:complete